MLSHLLGPLKLFTYSLVICHIHGVVLINDYNKVPGQLFYSLRKSFLEFRAEKKLVDVLMLLFGLR